MEHRHFNIPSKSKVILLVGLTVRAAEGGVLLHPFHTMFIGGAHSLEDVEQTLSVTQLAFEAVVNLDPQ